MNPDNQLEPNPLQRPLVRGRAKSAPPLPRGGWEGFKLNEQFGMKRPSARPLPSAVNGPKTAIRQQRGSTLLVALIMLVMLTLIALSAMRSTTTSIQVVGNAQFHEEAKAAAQKVIGIVLSNTDANTNFMSIQPAPQGVDVNGDLIDDYIVTITPKPSCLSSKAVDPNDPGWLSGCTSSIGAVCFWTVWDIRAEVTDVKTGASVVLHQGVKSIADQATVTASGC